MQGKGIVTGIITVAAVFDLVENPGTNGKAGGTVTTDFFAGDVFQQRFAFYQILAKIFCHLVGRQFMSITMGGNLVPSGVNFPDHLGKPLGQPSQDEEGGFGVDWVAAVT